MWLSIVSLVVSAAIAIWTAKIQREQVALQKRLLELEEEKARESKRAILSAYITQEFGSKRMNKVLRIENSGMSAAHIEEILVDGVSIYEHGAFLHRDEPVRVIGPRSHVDFLLVLTLGMKPPSHIKITWVDATREKQEFETTLTL